jgi:KAP family P-loop domain
MNAPGLSNAYALLIGVDTVAGSQRFHQPIIQQDTIDLARLLTGDRGAGYSPDQVTTLVGSNATRDGILTAMEKLSRIPPGADSIVLIFFCGPGALGPDGSYYFLTADSRFKDPAEHEIDPSSALAANELNESLARLEAGRVLVLLNSSFSSSLDVPSLGGYSDRPTPEAARNSLPDSVIFVTQGESLISACRPTQHSYYSKEAQNTVFTQALLEGLRGDAVSSRSKVEISIYDLATYMQRRVPELVHEIDPALSQDPVITVSQATGPFPVALLPPSADLEGAKTSEPVADASSLSPTELEQQVATNKASDEYDRGDPTKVPPSPGPAAPRRGDWLPAYSSDGQVPTDLLDVTRDVKAFATLIASKKVAPPLSIGLFGEWGSGKSTFMQLLKAEIQGLSDAAAASGKPQSKLPYYKHISQIDFNAWQYMDGNLWASLVTHIFEHLVNKDPEQLSEELVAAERAARVKQLGVAQAAEAEAQKQVDEAQTTLDASEAELRQAQDELQVAEQQAVAITPANILKEAFSNSDLQQALITLRQAIGLTPKPDEDLPKLYAETTALAQQSQTLTGSLLRDRQRSVWLIITPIIALIAGLAAALIANLVASDWFAQIAGVLTTLSGLIAGAAAWLHEQVKWAAERVKDIEQARAKLEVRLAEQTAAERAKQSQKKEALDAAQKRLNEAQQARAVARQKLAQAQQAAANVSADGQLAAYLEQRVVSTDYRKRLGILALIRQDFQTISTLIAHANRELEQVSNVDEEKKGEAGRINRIVLYIDDLDRCPADNVVQVLQAVNLLLGMELFVVIVAVDARWVRGSLSARYAGLLQNDLTDNSPKNEIRDPLARPLDYLEKIFQIPFWLNPVSEQGRLNMLRGLLEPKLAPDHPSSSAVTSTSAPADSTTVAQPPMPTTALPLTPTPLQPEVLPATNAMVSLHDELVTTALTVEPMEMDYIESLSNLLGRSPRALKRFVNTYMLIKARLGRGEQASFVLDSFGTSQYKIVLILLALVTNNPQVAPQFFRAIDNGGCLPATVNAPSNGVAPASTSLWPSIRSYVEAHSANLNTHPDWVAQWANVSRWLDTHANDLQTDWTTLDLWMRQVARYAYIAEPGWLS